MEPRNYVQEAEEIIKSEKIIFSNDFAKKILIWFFRQSENFTKPIAVSVYTQDPKKFTLFDETNSTLHKANTSIMFAFFKRRNIKMYFTCRAGIYLCQGNLAGFVKIPVPAKGYPRTSIGVRTHNVTNQEICTIFISPWEKSFRACEILDFNLEEVEAIELWKKPFCITLSFFGSGFFCDSFFWLKSSSNTLHYSLLNINNVECDKK